MGASNQECASITGELSRTATSRQIPQPVPTAQLLGGKAAHWYTVAVKPGSGVMPEGRRMAAAAAELAEQMLGLAGEERGAGQELVALDFQRALTKARRMAADDSQQDPLLENRSPA